MSVSSLFLRSGIASLAVLSSLSTPVLAAYQLDTEYSGSSFFDGFDFNTVDGSNGFVTYNNQSFALQKELISSGSSQPAYIGVDHTNVISPSGPGRDSVRIESKKAYNHGLFISDIAHMPESVCGVWPAHWTYGTTWPNDGEIDIIEGINKATRALMTLHTTPGCTQGGNGQLGALQTSDCDTSVNYNSGCSTLAQEGTYGTSLDSTTGGVFAMDWTSSYIRIYFFPRSAIPSDITNGAPDPTKWGTPQANFVTQSCDLDAKIQNQRIVFNTNFCGDYAGNVFNYVLNQDTCRVDTGYANDADLHVCEKYVAANPTAFTNAYWKINYVKVYKVITPVATTAPVTTLSSVTPQSSVVGVGMGGSSNVTATSLPYAAGTVASAVAGSTNPATIASFEYYGCAGSSSGFSTFTQIETSPLMSLDRCISDCSAYGYAGIYNTICYCANELDSSTSTSVAKGTCNNACPGNLNQLCGGTVSASRMVRQASNGILLSVYVNPAKVAAFVASGAASGAAAAAATATTAKPLASVVPAGQVFGYGMGGGAAATTTVIITTYVDVCPTGYTTITTTSTINNCGCVPGLPNNFQFGSGSVSANASFVFEAVTKVCNVCGPTGGPAVVTVTIPVSAPAVTTTASTTAFTAAVKPSNATIVLSTGGATTATATTIPYTGAANALAINTIAILAGVVALAAL